MAQLNLKSLLEDMVSRKGSDLHLTVGTSPQMRVDGDLMEVASQDRLGPEETQALAYSVLTEKQKKTFEETMELDFSFGIKGLSRFRGNLFMQRGAVAAVFRTIPYEILSFDTLKMPPIVKELSERPNGLVLITGPTGSGKSTTLAAMIDRINENEPVHILTIEDPIEFVHNHKTAIVNQRQLGADTLGFGAALRAALRQDPDVVLIGEMRDLETIEAALTIAETGHLAFGTLHTNSAAQTMNRLIDVFPTTSQQQVRTQLSLTLEGVVSQQLLPKIGGGRAAALEILICTPAVRALIRDSKIHQIYSIMQVGQKFGMRTMNQSLQELVQRREVQLEDALLRSPEPEELKESLSRGSR
ncbi:type IV pilus twitching motility protein PilT [Gemmatimonadota bacterium]